MARRCQINAPFQLTVDDIKLRLWICKEKCDYFWKHGKLHQQQHLNLCLERAQEQEDKAAEHQILAIIKREKDWAFWGRLNFALGKHIHGRSVRAVQVEDGAGGVIDYNTEETVHQAIFNKVHRKRYNLAEEAPICRGRLRGEFGYVSTSPTAQTVLDRTYDFPPDMDEATRELFEEIAQIHTMAPIGYSWFDGLLRNPWSGVQTPQVLGYSGTRVAEPLVGGSNPYGAGVTLRGWGLGSHMSNQGTLWHRFPESTRDICESCKMPPHKGI
jgi:hypothetical protein